MRRPFFNLADPYSLDASRIVNRSHKLAEGRRRWWKSLPQTAAGNRWYDLENQQTLSVDSTNWNRSPVLGKGWGSHFFNNSPVLLSNASTGLYHDPFSRWSMACTARLHPSPSANNYVMLDIGGSANGAALSLNAGAQIYTTTRVSQVFADSFEAGHPTSNGWTTHGGATLTQTSFSPAVGSFAARRGLANDPAGASANLSKTVSDFELILYTKRVDQAGGSRNRYAITESQSQTTGYGFSASPTDFGIEERWTPGWEAGTELATTPATIGEGLWYTCRFIKHGTQLVIQIWAGIQSDFSVPADATVSAVDSSYSSFGTFAILGGFNYDTDGIEIHEISNLTTSNDVTIESVYRSTGESQLTQPASSGKTHRILSTFDGPTQTHSLYVDGRRVGTDTTPFSQVDTHTDDAGLGGITGDGTALTSGNETNFHGSLDDIVIWDRSLSPQEAAEDYFQSVSYSKDLLNRTSTTRYFLPSGGGATVAVGTATETDTANAVTVQNPRSYTVGTASETDTANSVTVQQAQAVSVGTATETNTANAVSVLNPRTYSVGTASETETANSVSVANPRTYSVGTASETDTANAVTITNDQTVVVGTASESCVANSVSVLNPRAYTVGRATEVSIGRAVTILNPRTFTVGTASETDTANAASVISGATTAGFVKIRNATLKTGYATATLRTGRATATLKS